MRPLSFPSLHSLVLLLNNQTYPELLVKMFARRVQEAVEQPGQLRVLWVPGLPTIPTISSSLPNRMSHLWVSRPQQFSATSKVFHLGASVCTDEMKKLVDRSGTCQTGIKKLQLVLSPNSFSQSECSSNILSTVPSGITELSIQPSEVPPFYSPSLCSRLTSNNTNSLLTKLALPVCAFLDQHNSSKAVVLLGQAAPLLLHLEVLPALSNCRNRCNTAGAVVLKAVSVALPRLTKLLVRGVACRPAHSSLSFPSTLTQLHLSSPVGSNPPGLMPALARALQQAALTRLQVLQLYHPGATQKVQQIFFSLATHCPSLQQLVIVDPSSAFTIRKFPLQAVVDLVQKLSLRFLYICSTLLTKQDVKKLKSGVRELNAEKPFLLCHFQTRINDNPSLYHKHKPFYSLLDIEFLPSEYLSSVTGLDCQQSSDVAQIDLREILL